MSHILPAETRILAIDTAMDRCSVALLYKGNLTEKAVDAPREHTQRILPMVAEILRESDINLSELDGIAISNGPGSFTGLRIGLSVAQGLAYGNNLPLIPISTLHAMAVGAQRIYKLTPDSIIVPAIDARMDEVYWSEYRVETSKDKILNPLRALGKEQVGHPEKAYQTLASHTSRHCMSVGSGWRYSSVDHLHELGQTNSEFSSSAYDVAILAIDAFDKGAVCDPVYVEPTYLRNEIHWQKRQRIRQ